MDIAAVAEHTIVDVLTAYGRELRPMSHDVSLTDDLGFDSLMLVDLTVQLECALEVSNLRIQQWADSEAASNPPRFTVASLVRHCQNLVARD